MLVEDDPDLAELVMLQLKDVQCACTWVPNGRDALEKAQNEPFDMLILDIMLPEVDGLEICRTVRVLSLIHI